MTSLLRSTVLCAAVSAALVAGCTSAPPPPASTPTPTVPVESASPEASGSVAVTQVNAVDVQGWLAGPVPGGDASGPSTPQTWPVSQLVGGGQTTSLTPQLIVPAAAELSGDVAVQVVDLSAGGGFGADGRGDATGLVFEGTAGAKGFDVPSGTLADGSTYAWRARKGEKEWAGPWAFAVDTVRARNAPVDSVANVEVNLLSGVPAARWDSPTVEGVNGPFGVGLVYRPGQPEMPGLPAGWQWVLPGSGLIAVTESGGGVGDSADTGAFGGAAGPSSVTLRSANGGGLTFVRTETGAYVPGLADGTATAYSRGGVLTRMAPGVWQYSTSAGTLTRFESGRVVGEWAQGNPVGAFTWDESGRLLTVGDGISRQLSLAYEGAGECPASGWGNGFGVEAGLWCAATYADGTSTAVGYAGGQIGLIADPGGQALGFGWDASGRLSAVRQPLATAAAATQGGTWAGAALTTQLTYDREGRVESAKTAAAAPDGERLTRRYSYPAGPADDGKVSAEVTQQGGPSEGVVLEVTATSDEWQVLRRVTYGGLVTTNSYDDKTGVATKGTDARGLTTTTKLDQESLVTSSVGPFTGEPDRALRTDRTLDATVVDPDAGAESRTQAWKGLSAMLWAGNQGTAQWWNEEFFSERTLGGTVGAAGPWQAQASGLWKVPESGEWTIRPTAGDGVDVEVVVSGVRCPRDEDCVVRLRAGENAVSLAMRGDGPGPFLVKAGRGDAEPRGIPLEELRPNYNTPTLVTNNDVVSDSRVATKVYDIDRPWASSPRSVTASGGLRTEFAYEPAAPAQQQFGRQTQMTTPGGARMAQSYYALDEQATSPCTDSAAPQAGLAREVVRYDGVRITTVYDAAGRPVAVTTSGDGASETACTSYDAAGRTVATSVEDQAGTVLESATTSYLWADGQVTATTQYQQGGETYTIAATGNSRGQVVKYVDAWGATTTLSYDAEGRVTSRATAPAGSADPALTVDVTYQAGTGQVATVDANGDRLATAEYSDAGVLRGIEYAGGVSQSFGYANSGAANVTEITAGDVSIVQRRDRNAGGRTLGSSTQVKDGKKAVSEATWDYAFDDAGRLVSATLTTEGDTSATGGKKRTFGYDYRPSKECPNQGAGADFNRTGGSRDGTDFATCYDASGRMTWTTDPQLAPEGGRAEATYDGLGRLTRLDSRVPLEIAWAAATQASTVTQGDATTEVLVVGGQAIGDTTPAGTRRLTYASPTSATPAIITDDAGTITALSVNLPGGAIAYLDPSTAKPTAMDYPDLFLGFLATTAAGQTGLAPQYGPYGEPLVPQEDVVAAFGWQAQARNPSLTGSHDLTFSARPYHPWLGAFLAFDPEPGASPTGYGYGDGNPLDQPDTSGRAAEWDLTALILGGVAALLGVASGKVARSLPVETSKSARVAATAYQVTTVVVGLAGAGIAGARYFGLLGPTSSSDLGSASTWVAAAGMIFAGIGTYRFSSQVKEGVARRNSFLKLNDNDSSGFSEILNKDENYLTENQVYD